MGIALTGLQSLMVCHKEVFWVPFFSFFYINDIDDWIEKDYKVCG
jgi:hypothetical protein